MFVYTDTEVNDLKNESNYDHSKISEICISPIINKKVHFEA